MIPENNYQAKARKELCDFGESKEKKTTYVKVVFDIQAGEFAGQSLAWEGYFTEKASERTIQSLKYCGCTFPGNDITNLEGVDTNTVEIVVKHESWTDDQGNEKTRARIAFVNGGQRGISPEQQLDAAKKAAFAAKMRGTVALVNKGSGASNGTQKSTSDNIPF